MLNLRDLQSRFFYSIARPMRSADEEWRGFDTQLLQVIRPQGKLGAEARLDIYAQMYCARLLDALMEDFPRVVAILGEERFRELGRAYLRHFPSTHPSLRYLGTHFAEFLTSHSVGTSGRFLGDLARLERARLDVFDAPDAEPLRLEDLQTIPADAWATIRFQFIPALQTLTCAWPVQTIWKNEQFTQSEEVEPATTVLRVWRHDFAVYQASMDTLEQTALTGIQAGEPFAAVCTILDPLVNSPEEASTLIGSLLLRWIEDGILARNYEV
jgi:hypothetical protein